jgi:hypothetical protein
LILSRQPSTTIKTTVIRILSPRSTKSYPLFPGISPRTFTPPTVAERELYARQGYFHNFLRSSGVFQSFSCTVALRQFWGS